METNFFRVDKLVLILLVSLIFSACGGGGGSAPYKTITNPLYSELDGTNGQLQNFPGVASFIDTKVIFSGADMFLGLSIDSTAKSLITKNINSYLETSSPGFDAGLSPLPTGITVDSTTKKITFKDANSTVSWSFSGSSVVRSYVKNAGAEPSTWTYSYSSATGLTTAVFSEPLYVTAPVNNTTTKTSYSGTVKYVRAADSSLSSLTSADFAQTHTETNSATGLTWKLDGSVKMTGTTATAGNFSFDGDFSFDLPSYKTVTGKTVLNNGTYGSIDYVNIDNASLTLSSQTDYSDYKPVITTVLTHES